MVIFYSCNSNYVNQTMVSMLSVMRFHREEIEFLIVGDRLSEAEKKKMQRLVDRRKCLIRFFEIESVLGKKSFMTSGRHPRSIYAKLFPDRLTTAKRILYLDSDVIANRAFSELFSMDLQGAVIAGVQMPYAKKVLERQGIEGETFLCDGIVLIDVEQWKRKQLSKKAIEYIHCCKPEWTSESVINFICQGQIFILPPCYHLMPQFLVFHSWELKRMHRIEEYYSERELEEARKNPILIHFMKELYIRPWHKKSRKKQWNHPYCGLYIGYQKRLGIELEGEEELSIRTQVLRNLYERLPFSIFLRVFFIFHRD